MIHITKGNGKLELINSINTNPLVNDFCLRMSQKPNTICSNCYSMKTLRRWRAVEKPLNRNTIELSETVLPIRDLPTINALYFRFNSHGELINKNHIYNLLNICQKNPKVQFALWTKRIDIIALLNIETKPENLIVVYSSPMINQTADIHLEYFDKVFTVFTEYYTDENFIILNCNKKCINCLKCYTHNHIREINEIIK